MWMRLTDLGSWGRCIGHVAMNCRSFSHPWLPRPSSGGCTTTHGLCTTAGRHTQLPWGTVGKTKLLSTLRRSYWSARHACRFSQLHPVIAWSSNGISCLCCPRKSYAGQIKVMHHSLDGASIWQVPFLWDEDGNHYLLVGIDLFSKLVKPHGLCPHYTARGPAEFLYNDLVARWGKQCYVWTDNGTIFAGSFAWLCKDLGIIHHHITIGNSKANGQVEWTITMLKD